MSQPIRLTDDDVVAALKQFIEDSDGDVIAQMVAEYFGGECEHEFWNDREDQYVFTPGENYGGAFDKQAKAQGMEVDA